MKVVSINGITNDGADYGLWLEQPFSQPGLKLETVETAGDDSQVTTARPQARVLSLHILVGINSSMTPYSETTRAPLREALLAALDTRATAVALVISDNDGAHERYVYVVVQKLDEQPDAEGMGAYFVATLVTHRDTTWRAVAPHTETWVVTASGQTRAVTNGSGRVARPVYTVQPTEQKTGAGNRYTQKKFVALPWWLPTTRDRPVDITNLDQLSNGGLDTAALVLADDISEEKNIGVVVDGQEVRRWITNFDTDHTQIWINIDLESGVTATLLNTIGSGDTVTFIVAGSATDNFPHNGIIRINNEVFTYSDKDDRTRTFLGVARAAKGSSAASHSGNGKMTGSVIEWIQHDIWLVYGPDGQARTDFSEDRNGASIYVEYDAYKPMLDLAVSRNNYWQFLEFGQGGNDGRYRTAQWQPSGSLDGTATDSPDVFDKIMLQRASSYSQSQALGPSAWTLPVVSRIYYLQVNGNAFRYEATGNWDAKAYLDYSPYVVIPNPATLGNETGQFEASNLAVEGTGKQAYQVRIAQQGTAAMLLEVDAVQIAFDVHGAYFNEVRYSYPSPTMYPAIETYDMALVLENQTTGQFITLSTQMTLDDRLEVDTYNHTVKVLDDGSGQYQAVSKDARRKDILPLRPGVNSLKVTEAGLNGVTIYITFEEQSYT